jgi:hypothetical protein
MRGTAIIFTLLLATLAAFHNRAETRSVSGASVNGTDGLRFVLTMGTCSKRYGGAVGLPTGCPMVIQLLSGRKVLDSVPLTFVASDAQLKKIDDANGLGTDAHLDAWTAGAQEGAVTTAVQAVKLTPNRVGLLVHQVGGFEHTKRHHDLFVVNAGKLRKAWSQQDGQGPAFSSADVVAVDGEQREEILYIAEFFSGAPELDKPRAQHLVWNESAGKLEEHPANCQSILTRFPMKWVLARRLCWR